MLMIKNVVIEKPMTRNEFRITTGCRIPNAEEHSWELTAPGQESEEWHGHPAREGVMAGTGKPQGPTRQRLLLCRDVIEIKKVICLRRHP